jgi:hypothetical protein
VQYKHILYRGTKVQSQIFSCVPDRARDNSWHVSDCFCVKGPALNYQIKIFSQSVLNNDSANLPAWPPAVKKFSACLGWSFLIQRILNQEAKYIGCEGRIHWPLANMVRGRREGKTIFKFWGTGKGWYGLKVLRKRRVMLDKSLVEEKGVLWTKGLGDRVRIDKNLVEEKGVVWTKGLGDRVRIDKNLVEEKGVVWTKCLGDRVRIDKNLVEEKGVVWTKGLGEGKGKIVYKKAGGGGGGRMD